MRKRGSVAIVVAMMASITPTYAAGEASKIWFLSLDTTTRTALQADLVLVGDYDALIDGNFGSSTFSALQAYQRSIDDPATGVLSPKEIAALQAEAASVQSAFGLQKTADAAADLEISVPTKLLPTRTISGNGTSYRSANGDFELDTSRIAASDPKAFDALFQERDTAGPSRTISYAHLGQSSFTVTGSASSGYFYDRFYRSGTDTVGFTLTWASGSADRGTLLAAYLASFSGPLNEGGAGAAQQASPPPQTVAATAANNSPAQSSPANETGVSLQPDGGTFVVPVTVNGALRLNFTVDSGASDVTIPADVMSTLVRTGTVSQSDITGTQTYTMADGSTKSAQTFIIRSLGVGDKVVEDVAASVSPTAGIPLLGQSFLTRFSSWSMDNGRHVLLLGNAEAHGIGDGIGGGLPPVGTAPLPPDVAAPRSADMPPSVASLPPQSSAQSTARLALYGGLDFYGNDIFKGRVTDAVHCATSCLGDSQCRAFTFNANPDIHTGPNCFLKSGVNRLEAYSTAIGGLLLQPQQSTPHYSFDAIDPTTDLLVNRDFPAGDLSNYPYTPARTLDDCRMACIDNQQCEAFSYVKSPRQCWLKASAGSSRFARGIVSGTKRQVSIAAEDVINVPR